MIIFYDAHCLEYSTPGHPEGPARITRTAPFLKERHPDWEWQEPAGASESALLRATHCTIALTASQSGILTRIMATARKRSLRTIPRSRLHLSINSPHTRGQAHNLLGTSTIIRWPHTLRAPNMSILRNARCKSC